MATYEKVSKLQQLKDTLKDMTWNTINGTQLLLLLQLLRSVP